MANETTPRANPDATKDVKKGATKSAASKRTDIVALRAAIAEMSAKQRYDTILSCHDVRRVLKLIPTQDVFFLLKEIGIGDALELIELLQPRQVQHILDLDGWRKDRVDVVSIGNWFEAMFAANADRAVRQMQGLDIEFLTLIFKMHVDIFELGDEHDPPDIEVGFHTITPDQKYLIVFREALASIELLSSLKQFVDRSFERDATYMMRLIESIRWELPSQLEEDANRFRLSRLADLGFLDVGESQEVFAYQSPDGPIVDKVHPPPPLDRADDDEDEVSNFGLSPTVAFPRDAQTNYFLRVLEGATPDVKVRVRHELLLTTNRVHFALGNDLGDPATVRDTALRVVDTAGIGLSYLARENDAEARALLSRAHVLTLFRRGHSVVLEIARRLRVLIRDQSVGLDGDGLLRVDAPLRDVMAGVLRPRPLLFAGLTEPARIDFRHFSSLSEVALAAKATTEGAFRAALLGPRGVGATDAKLATVVDDSALHPGHATLLATALVRQLLGAPFSIDPLDDDQVVALVERVRSTKLSDEDRDRALDALDAIAERAFPLPGTSDPSSAKTRARAYGERVLGTVVEELSPITGVVDAQMLSSVWTRASLVHAQKTRSAS